MVIERKKYIAQLLDSRHNGLIKIITGIRRCGKSFLLFNLFKRQLEMEGVDKEHIIEMAFDDFANRQYRDPNKFYQYVKSLIKDGRMYYILLDEVQMLDEFEDVLNGLLHIENADVYVTGSNAKFLSKDIITEFRGRGFQIHVCLSWNKRKWMDRVLAVWWIAPSCLATNRRGQGEFSKQSVGGDLFD